MDWDWKLNLRKNFYKIMIHEGVELLWLGSWVIALNHSWEGWLIGVTGSIVIHMGIFHGIDFLHEHHHHHEFGGHADHKDIN